MNNHTKLLSHGLAGIVFATALVACNGATGPAKQGTTNPADEKTSTTKPAAINVELVSTVWIKLKWKDLGAGMSYEVYRGTTADFEPTYNSLVSPPGHAKLFFDDDQLTAGKTYYYKLYARSHGSTGPATHIGDISATTPTKD